MAKKISIIGAGTWGTALGEVLASNEHDVTVWDIAGDLITTLDSQREHPKLSGIKLNRNIHFERDFNTTVDQSELIVLVVPSPAVHETFDRFKETLGDGIFEIPLVVCTKGMDRKNSRLFSELAQEIFGEKINGMYCVLSGPTHAEEVALRMPTTIVAASNNDDTAAYVQEIFSTDYFRVYTQQDVPGVEIGAAVKNIVAIAAGAAEGLGYGDNTKAAILTRGLAEIMRLGMAFGAQAQTFAGLAGIGDIIVTATSKHSRNRLFGELIAKGRSVDEAIAEIGMVVEGFNTVETAIKIARERKVSMPITESVHHCLFEGVSPEIMVSELMTRPLTSE